MVWLIGNKGMLGTELSNKLSACGIECVGTDREVDITDSAALERYAESLVFRGKSIRAVINCAAYTAVDKAEDDRDLCSRLNEDGPANIASCAAKYGAVMLHISTDYVFNGNGERPYREDDPTDPTGVYGLTKRDGESAALANNPRTWILRTAWLYGAHGNNFVHTMLRLMAEKTELKVVNDQRGTPTWAKDLCEAICAFLLSVPAIAREAAHPEACAYKTVSSPEFGIYHFSNEGNISWFDFANEIYLSGRDAGLLDPSKNCSILPCTSAEFPAKVRRPPYSVLDKSKIRAVLDRDIPDWKASLKEYLSSKENEI